MQSLTCVSIEALHRRVIEDVEALGGSRRFSEGTSAGGAYLLGETGFAAWVLLALSVLVFWTHRENIKRLLAGTEPKFGSKSKTE